MRGEVPDIVDVLRGSTVETMRRAEVQSLLLTAANEIYRLRQKLDLSRDMFAESVREIERLKPSERRRRAV